MPTIVITGIDTDIGKTIATGLLARYLVRAGYSVITQKLVQTGCTGMSDDIRRHRQLMGMDLTSADLEGLTCPYVFPLPASPHLAASQENVVIQTDRITQATQKLEQKYEWVLLEGIGGMYVPLNSSVTLIDYIWCHQYPVILVSRSKLGSINHTLLTLEAAHQRQITVLGIVYNQYPEEHPLITQDSKHVFATFLQRFAYRDVIVFIPYIDVHGEIPDIDFSAILQPSAPPLEKG